MIKNVTTIIVLFIAVSGFAQTDEDELLQIEAKSSQIDSGLRDEIKTSQFKLDSVEIRVNTYQEKIKSEIKFAKSDKTILAEFYFDTDKIILARFTEKSPHSESFKDAKKVTKLYFQNGEVIEEKVRTTIPGELHGVGLQKNSEKEFGYNQRLTSDYLKKLTEQIIEKMVQY